MFSLSRPVARARHVPMSKPSLPSSPWDWGKQMVLDFLDSKNPRRSADRTEVKQHLAALGSAIRLECSGGYSSVEDVLKANPDTLPIQLRAYRELYEYMLVWLK